MTRYRVEVTGRIHIEADGEELAVTLVRDTPEGIWVTGLPEQADVIVLGQEYVTAGVTVTPTFRDEAPE